MASRHWQPNRMAALVIVILLWPAVLICLSDAPGALAQSAGGCSISSADVTLNATCALDDAGNLTGSFTAPQLPASQSPSACQTFAGGNISCANQITVSACADVSSTLCASAPFSIETNIVGAPASTSPVLARTIADTGTCTAACHAGRTAGVYEPAVTVELAAGNPVITLAPSLGQPGSSVAVTGSGFAIAPVTSPPVTSPPVTSPPVTSPPATSPPPVSSPPVTDTPRPVPAPSSFLLPGVAAIGVVAVLVAVVLLLRRRPPHGGPPHGGPPPPHVHARVSDAMPRPVMRNTAGRPTGIVRIEVHRQSVEPRIEKRTRR
jgi:hypothetical protein